MEGDSESSLPTLEDGMWTLNETDGAKKAGKFVAKLIKNVLNKW